MYENHEYNREVKKTSIYLPQVATITKKSVMTPFDTLFEFKPRDWNLGHSPGQFVEISIPGIGEAPFYISSPPATDNRFEIVIRNVGTLTNAIHSLQVGEKIGVRGPYGKSLPLEDLKGKSLVFIAGGLGLAVIRSAVKFILGNRDNYKKISILYGCLDPCQRLFVDELIKWKYRGDIDFHETVETTDLSTYLELTHMDLSCSGLINEWKSQEWRENIGVITTLFPKLNNIDPQESYAIVVGPPVMYKYVILNLRDLGFSDNHIIVSLERRIRCGLGKCGHCQMNDIYVCQDGPLFYFSDINHVREAF